MDDSISRRKERRTSETSFFISYGEAVMTRTTFIPPAFSVDIASHRSHISRAIYGFASSTIATIPSCPYSSSDEERKPVAASMNPSTSSCLSSSSMFLMTASSSTPWIPLVRRWRMPPALPWVKIGHHPFVYATSSSERASDVFPEQRGPEIRSPFGE